MTYLPYYQFHPFPKLHSSKIGYGIKQRTTMFHLQITQDAHSSDDEFEFNKDEGMYVCKAGHMAIRKARTGKKNQKANQMQTYYFYIEKCQVCPLKKGCYKKGTKSKTYSVTIKSTVHKDYEILQNNE